MMNICFNSEYIIIVQQIQFLQANHCPWDKWVRSCMSPSPFYLPEGKECPSHEKSKQGISNVVTVETSSDMGELLTFVKI